MIKTQGETQLKTQLKGSRKFEVQILKDQNQNLIFLKKF